jgi:nucleotide-binding universal stress UspA family protein
MQASLSQLGKELRGVGKERWTMYRQIMVPLDGSEVAEQALAVADQLARLYRRRAVLGGVTIHLVRVVDPIPVLPWGASPFGMLNMPESTLDHETEAAAEYLEMVRYRLSTAGLEVRVSTLIGTVSAALLEYERSARIDLVIMSSHGRTGLARLVMGSVAESLMRQGQAPVLLVHPSGDPLRLDHAVVPLDGSPEAERALLALRELSLNAVREATLLQVIYNSQQYLPAMRYLSRIALQPELAHLTLGRLVVVGDPVQTIRDIGSRKLVVLTRRRRSPYAHWGANSVVDGVAHRDVGAVLVARHDAARHDDSGRRYVHETRLERGSM